MKRNHFRKIIEQKTAFNEATVLYKIFCDSKITELNYLKYFLKVKLRFWFVL